MTCVGNDVAVYKLPYTLVICSAVINEVEREELLERVGEVEGADVWV